VTIKHQDKIETLHEKMQNCFQFTNISMLDHGLMVSEEYQKLKQDLMLSLQGKSSELEKIGLYACSSSDTDSDWIKALLQYQYDENLMQHYHLYHDCGKPFCRELDEENRQHFPNHAMISMQIYREHFNCDITARLIEADMNFHTMNAQQMQQWLNENKEDKYFLASLYLSAWAEILANSTMFGGIESEGFKIKRKKLIQHGKKLNLLLLANVN
jgi:hypothetical protein